MSVSGFFDLLGANSNSPNKINIKIYPKKKKSELEFIKISDLSMDFDF